MANSKGTIGQRLTQPWLVRRIIYILAGIVGAVAAVFFGATADHLATIDRVLATATPIILALVSTLAAPKANPGADAGEAPDPVVIEQAPEPVDWGAVAADAAQQVIDRLVPAGQHRADAQTTLDALREGLAVKD